MNEASQWRLDLAREIALGYTENPKVAALVVAGSVGRGNADRYSDIELDVYWCEPPSDQDRMAPIVRAQGKVEIFWPYSAEEEEWGEEYDVSGVKVGISSFLTSSIDRWLTDVLEHDDTSILKQMRLAAIQHCIPLHGTPTIAAWQSKATNYGASLKRAIISEYLADEVFGAWYGRHMLAARDDRIMLYDLFCRVEKCIVGTLLGLNQIYLANPSFKWMDDTIAQMTHKPHNLAGRLKRAFSMDPPAGVAELDKLLAETLALIETHLPAMDLTEFKVQLRRQRAVVEIGDWRLGSCNL